MTNIQQSYIGYDKEGAVTSFNGPEAVELFRVAALISALDLASAGLSLGRGYLTKTQLLGEATKYTGKPYKRTEYNNARSDLRTFLEQEKKKVVKVVQ